MTDAARWAQLTYASIPAGAGGDAGWRVKQVSGAPADAETEELLARAVTRFDSHVPFPPLGEESAVYERLPRRFGYAPLAGGRGVWWHAGQVDKDGFGRTGNVFNHLVLDRRSADPEPIRPVTWWRSRDILSPHWYSRIDAAVLGPDRPADGASITTDTVLDFVFDAAHWQRVLFLPVLVDAVFAALSDATAPRVLLRIDDAQPGWQDEAALWVGAVSFALSPRDARRLAFSLYERGTSERGASAVAALARDLHLAVVPESDEIADAETVAVLTPHDTQGATGGVHGTSAGRPVRVGRASQLVGRTMSWREGAAAQFAAIDDVSTRIGGAATSDPAWALAMATVLQSPVEAPVEATEIIAVSTPREVAGDDELRRAVDAVVEGTIGDDLDSISQSLQRIGAGTYTYDMCARAYLKKAVGDRDWLVQAGGVPVPDPLPADPGGYLEATRAALEAALEEDPGEDGALLRHLRLVDLVARTVPPAHRTEALDAQAALVARSAIGELMPGGAAVRDVLRAHGAFSDTVVDAYITPALRAAIASAAAASVVASRTDPAAAAAVRPAPGPNVALRVPIDTASSIGSAPAAVGASVFAVPPDLLDTLYARRPPVPEDGDHTARLEWDVRARGAQRAIEQGGAAAPEDVERLAGEFLRRYGSWRAIPRDGRALVGSGVRGWTASTLLRVVEAASGDRMRAGGASAAVAVPADLARDVLAHAVDDDGLEQLIRRVQTAQTADAGLVALADARDAARRVDATSPGVPWLLPAPDEESERLGALAAVYAKDRPAWSRSALVALAVSLGVDDQRARALAPASTRVVIDALSDAAGDPVAVAGATGYLAARAREAEGGRRFAVTTAALAFTEDDPWTRAARRPLIDAAGALPLPGPERLIDRVARDAIDHWATTPDPVTKDDVFARVVRLLPSRADPEHVRRDVDRWWKRFAGRDSPGLLGLGKNLFSGKKAGGDA